jgi:hypothetical protein
MRFIVKIDSTGKFWVLDALNCYEPITNTSMCLVSAKSLADTMNNPKHVYPYGWN